MAAAKEPDFETSSPQMVLPAVQRNMDPPQQIANAASTSRPTTGQGFPIGT